MTQELNDKEYIELYELLKYEFEKCKNYYKHYDKNSVRYFTILNARITLSERHSKIFGVPRNRVLSVLRDASRAKNNLVLSTTYGAKIVENIFNIIDNDNCNEDEVNISELKNTVENMVDIGKEAEIIANKCNIVAENMSSIEDFIEGNIDELKIKINTDANNV